MKNMIFTPLSSCCLLLLGLGIISESLGQLLNVTTTTTTTGNNKTLPETGPKSEELKKFEAWQQHPLYLAPFDPKVISMPELQLAFIREMTAKDMKLFREIADEAIENRKKFAPSVKLMFKYTGKLLGTLIKNRKTELKLPQRIEPKPEFFTMLADMAQAVIDRSGAIKNERGYSKNSVDVKPFKARIEANFNYVKRIIDTCPIGGYLKWNELVLFKDEPKNPLYKANFIEEISDLAAQFRAMGYESATFVGRRIVNMIRLFGKGIVPSENEV